MDGGLLPLRGEILIFIGDCYTVMSAFEEYRAAVLPAAVYPDRGCVCVTLSGCVCLRVVSVSLPVLCHCLWRWLCVSVHACGSCGIVCVCVVCPVCVRESVFVSMPATVLATVAAAEAVTVTVPVTVAVAVAVTVTVTVSMPMYLCLCPY